MQALTRFALATSLAFAIACVSFPQTALAGDRATPTPSKTVHVGKKKNVEVVFVLDTTGSMGGLIEGAKRKIWFVANEILKAKQQPNLKVGLVAYRDKGDAYVTQKLALTDDLDEVYTKLMSFRADGGGDFEEDVNAGLNVAINDMAWSKPSKDTLKMVFLVGDAPAHMNYNEVTHEALSKTAIQNHIYINTLQCGGNAQTASMWKEIARNSEGRYAAIPQDGGVRVVTTPFDDELGRLAAELDTTYLDYGRRDLRMKKAKDRSAAGGYAMAAPSSAKAERAMAKSKAGPSKSADLVALLEAEGEDALDKVSDDKLDDNLRKMSKAERKKKVKELKAKRTSIQKKIAVLEKKRAAHLKAATEAKPSEKLTGFDAEVVGTLHKQAEKVGLTYN